MPVIGLTGSIASGKSLVSGILGELGAKIVDADQVAREVVEPGTSVIERIREAFGSQVINPDGTLNRKALGRQVFDNALMLKQLNEITHPAINRRISGEVEAFRQAENRRQATGANQVLPANQVRPANQVPGTDSAFEADKACGQPPVLVIDAPLLLEVGLEKLADQVWVVDVAEEERIRRLMKRDGLTREEALARINSQMPAAEKRARADVVIDNSGEAAATRAVVLQLWRGLAERDRGGAGR